MGEINMQCRQRPYPVPRWVKRALWRTWLVALFGACSFMLATGAWAAAPRMSASYLLGPESAGSGGWFSVGVELGGAKTTFEGELEVLSEVPWRDQARLLTRTPVSVAAGARVFVELPTHGFKGMSPVVTARLRDQAGRVVREQTLADASGEGLLVYHFSTPSPLAAALRAEFVMSAARAGMGPTSAREEILVASPPRHGEAGALLLPRQASGYAAATLVLAKTGELLQLSDKEREALANWVLGGGALALDVSSPEHLRAPVLSTLLGGEARATDPHPGLLAPQMLMTPSEDGLAVPTSRYVAPTIGVKRALAGYAGGNLHPSPWGASAAYGLGEVHLLAFQPEVPPFVGDDWVRLKIVDLLRHASEREDVAAFRSADLVASSDLLRRFLDPNEAARWTIACAALLLLAYAVIAGPLNFHRARRQGRPITALLRLPIFAFVTTVSILVLGLLAKGFQGKARQLVLLEAGAGMSRAQSVAFRGLYASNADTLTVWARSPSAVLDVWNDDADAELVVSADGARLEELQAKPWQTLVVREDGFAQLAGGVSLVDDPAGGFAITNRLGHDLEHVVARDVDGSAAYFEHIASGQSVRLSDGDSMPSLAGSSVSGTRGLVVHDFSSMEKNANRTYEAWEALSSVGPDARWWPAGVPALIAQVKDAAPAHDSGLAVEEAYTLLRVVGYGGTR